VEAAASAAGADAAALLPEAAPLLQAPRVNVMAAVRINAINFFIVFSSHKKFKRLRNRLTRLR
jgi:hypothetical protein